MPVKKLNDAFIKNYKAPDKREEIYDSLVTGLALRITPTGHKSFVYRYRYNSKVKRFTIGTYPKIGLSEARKQAKKISTLLSQGKDPMIEKQKAKHPKEILTFNVLCDRYIQRHLPDLRKSTSDEYERIINKELIPVLGKFWINDISKRQIVDLLDSIAIERGKKTFANRVRATLSSIYSFGVKKAIVDTNPVPDIQRQNSEVKRNRVYSDEEIKIMWFAFDLQQEPIRSLFKMLLLLGQRSGETKKMRWDEIKNNIWTIPANKTKANREQRLPLPEFAISILKELKPQTGKSDYVFESPINENQYIKWLQSASDRIQELSKISDFRIHDLRRTAATKMAELGVDRTVLGKVLNHKGLAGDHQVTAIYDRNEYMEEKRIALLRWSERLQDIISGKTRSANVTNLK